MHYTRIALATLGATAAYFGRARLTMFQAIAFMVQWVIAGIVIGLIYR